MDDIGLLSSSKNFIESANLFTPTDV